MSGQDFFRARRHRGARRLPRRLRAGRRSPRSPSSTDRCRTMRCWRSGRSATSAALAMLAGAAADRAARRAAVDRRGHLPARHQLRVAQRIPDRDAEVRDRERRLPGAAARRGRRAGGAAVSRATRTPPPRCSTQGAPTRDPARAAIALALGTVALRNTRCSLKVLEQQTRRSTPLPSCCARRSTCSRRTSRRSGSSSACAAPTGRPPDGSPARKVAARLIQKLEF